ncbi:anthranilate synthase component I family protein [Gryllotalpicola reticulitermitis]|uniref:Anthranilate synthase component I family protein n=1 Tax=Gryllotalpicola reticulitermitis TaxID=1184153 RepID=A0ABV8Q412_9MICO
MVDSARRRRLQQWVDPSFVYSLLCEDHTDLVWSDRSAASTDRVDVIAVPDGPADVVLCSADGAVSTGGVMLPAGEDAFASLAAVLRGRLDGVDDACAASRHLGWWGWIGFELGVEMLGVRPHPDESPAAAFVFASRAIEFDHDLQQVTLVALPGQRDWLDRMTHRLESAAEEEPRAPARSGAVLIESRWRHEHEAYLDLIAACQAKIRAGSAYQLCLTNLLTARFDRPVDPLALYLRLRAHNPVRNGGIVRIAGWTLVSASPEEFLSIDARGHAITRPIKGTRPRSASRAADAALVAELLASDKERAENLMIVDLMRNDLSRVARLGSVEVSRLFEIVSYPSVHQLVSSIEAELTVDAIEAVRSLFPAGSMTGAPKISAVAILRDLEGGPRGIYSGAWGRLGVDGSADLAVVIRSIVLHDDEARIGAGGGITVLSDPASEWREVELKAQPLLTALLG